MASPKKHPTKYPGVRYYELPERGLSKGKADRYYSIRFRLGGKLKEEGLGWASEGWSPERAFLLLAELKTAQTTGNGPCTLGEKRERKRQEDESRRRQALAHARERMTFDEVWLLYFADAQANKSRGSWQREESLYRIWIKSVLGDRPLREIKPLHLERIKKNLRTKGRASDSIRYALAVVRQVFNFATRNDLFLGDSPVRHVKFPHGDNRRLRFLKVHEAEALLKALERLDVRVHDMALLSLDCGLRRGEIFGLTWQDVDLEGGTLILRNTKNGRTRYAYATGRTKTMLERRAAGGNQGRVFSSERETLVAAITRGFGRALKELGFNEGVEDARHKVVFHTLRHTYASRLAENGVSLYTIKELLGHRTMAMTERYAHLSQSALRESVQILEVCNAPAGSAQEPGIVRELGMRA